MGFLPGLQCQAWIPSYGVSFLSHQKVIVCPITFMPLLCQWTHLVCQVDSQGSPVQIIDDFSPPSAYTVPSGTIKLAVRKGVCRSVPD